jgi:ribosomal-protein-alanine N-acetyltransferase
MELEDIPQVLEVDRESYTLPWPASAYRREILHNRNAHYVVLRQIRAGELREGLESEPEEKSRLFPFLPWPRRIEGPPRPGRIIGYAGMWLVIDEAHITTIAVREAVRGQGLGELLLTSLIEAAAEMGADRMTLEVRVTNEAAQRLYEKYGFKREGVRARYYSDNNEDAYIMTVSGIRDEPYRSRFDQQLAALRTRLERQPDMSVVSPVFSFPDATGAAEGT